MVTRSGHGVVNRKQMVNRPGVRHGQLTVSKIEFTHNGMQDDTRRWPKVGAMSMTLTQPSYNVLMAKKYSQCKFHMPYTYILRSQGGAEDLV